MAWVKMRQELLNGSKLASMATFLTKTKAFPANYDPRARQMTTFGGLFRVWCEVNEQGQPMGHGLDAILPAVDLDALDLVAQIDHFGVAMQRVGFASETPTGVVFPDFMRHNGLAIERTFYEENRKRRNRDRMRRVRGLCAANDAHKVNTVRDVAPHSGVRSQESGESPLQQEATELLGRSEVTQKSLSGIEPSVLPTGRRPSLKPFRTNHEAERFQELWQHYPNKKGRKAAERAFTKIPPHTATGVLLKAISEQKTWPQWTKDDGQFIPHFSTWLNGQRWNDQAPRAETTRDQLKKLFGMKE